jgi:3-phenylpropionate/trans-cinnamate dioxygenase ferredoxin reductase subunit
LSNVHTPVYLRSRGKSSNVANDHRETEQLTQDPLAKIVVVGGGQAAVELAFGLRKDGHAGRVLIVSEELHLPYQRPPLSKGYLTGKVALDDLYLRPLTAYEEANIELVLGTRVQSLDRSSRRLIVDDGSSLDYDLLALTVGGRPRQLPILDQERGSPNVHYVRSIVDVDALREQARPGQRVVIVGGGYIGLEAASVAVALGAQVTVVEAMPRVLARVTARHMSEFYESVHRDHGVRILTGASVVAASTNERTWEVTSVRLGSGEVLETDVLVVGIGLIPNTEMAEEAGLLVDGGIVVDESCRTSDPRIFAAGDCTMHPSPQHGGDLIRVESVSNAVEQGRVAAREMAGKAAVHNSVPWFWSDQYDLKLHMVGRSTDYDQIVQRGSAEEKSFTTFYLAAGRLIGADSVNRPADFAWARRLVAKNAAVPSAALADVDVPLKSLLTQG